MEQQLQSMSVTELKAAAFDQIVTVEQAQNNLKFINQELNKRFQQQSTPSQPPVVQQPPVAAIPSGYTLKTSG